MSSNGPRKQRLDSGYGTDYIPSPLSANVRAKPIFFGDEYTPGKTEVKTNSQEEKRTRESNSHEDVGPSQDGEDEIYSIEGVDVIEDISDKGAACDSVFKTFEVIDLSIDCDIVHNELGDGGIEGCPDTNLLTEEFDEKCSISEDHAPVVSSSSQSCVQIDKILRTKLTDDLGFPLKRTASLPDFKIMRMHATQEVGRRLRRLSDEFHYIKLYAGKCETCSTPIRNDQSKVDDNS